MGIEIRIAGKGDIEAWDRIVEQSPYGSIFHTWKWLKIMERHSNLKIKKREYKAQLFPVIGLKDNEPIAIFPLFLYKTPMFRSVFSPPLGTGVTYLGPVMLHYNDLPQNKRESIFEEFQKKVDGFIFNKLKVNNVRIRSPPDFIDVRSFLWAGYDVEPLYNYITDITVGPDKVWENFNRNIRKKIQMGKNEKINIVEGTKKDISFVWELLTKRYNEQGTDFEMSKKFIVDICKHFHPKNIRILIAKHQRQRIGGAVIIAQKDKVIAWLGMTKSNDTKTHHNDLLFWEMLKWACKNGYARFEVIWANDQRLCHYKSQFNPELSMYFSMSKSSVNYRILKKVNALLGRD